MAMIYDATAKLKFNEDPVLKIKDVELTVRSDADVLLQLGSVLEIIPHTPFGMHVLRIRRILLNLLTKSSDMHIHRPYITRIICSPYQSKQLFSSVNPILI